MSWENKKQVIKGTIGEDIIRERLESKEWIVYKPITKAPHWFDMMACKNKENVIAIEVKTKARFNKWHAQGVNVRHYNEYINFVNKTKIPLWLIFVDDKTGDVHAADISKLKNGFIVGKKEKIIAWPLSQMKYVTNIGQENVKKLTQYDTRNYEFQPSFNFS